MARTSILMSDKERRSWAEYYDAQKKAGVKPKRVGGMEMMQDLLGAWYQRNGDACPGKGYDQQAINDSPRYRKAPATPTNPKGLTTRQPWPWEKF